MVSSAYGFNHSARPNRDWNVTIRLLRQCQPRPHEVRGCLAVLELAFGKLDQGIGDAFAVRRVRLGAIGRVALLDVP